MEILEKSFFADTTEEYVIPSEPAAGDMVKFLFRLAADAKCKVYLVSERVKKEMYPDERKGSFTYYVTKVQMTEEKFTYHFEIEWENEVYIYDMRGASREVSEYFSFTVIPGFSTPDWAKGAVMYQIYVDRFCNGDPTNDVLSGEYKYINGLTVKKDWEEPIGNNGIHGFYGGDLEGVLQKLDYLKDLGIEVIYFNPLFVSPSNHKYDIQDYEHIDPHFGKIVEDEGELLQDAFCENTTATKYINRVSNPKNLEASDDLFRKVVEEAHKRGIRVILDGVFNHCGSFNKWLDREKIYASSDASRATEAGAYVSGDSPYKDYFYFEKNEWPDNAFYEGWWGHNTLPKLNYDSPKLYNAILNVGKKWVSAPYNADGWRLDVAADLGKTPEQNHAFWKDFRNAVKGANKDALILAEHYGDPSSWLGGDEWDSVMNYDAFMEPVTWFLTGMQKHSDEYRRDLHGNENAFWESMLWNGAKFTNTSKQVAMNELSNHDHSRFLTRTNGITGRVECLGSNVASAGVKKAVMREAVMMQMTWPGAPTVYYGDEAGLCGFTDPDNRRPYPWGKEDEEMIAFHKAAIAIHKGNLELRTGSIMPLFSTENFLSYARMAKDEVCLILINNKEEEFTPSISVWETGIPHMATVERLLFTTENGFDEDKETIWIGNGVLTCTMPKTSAMILKYRKQ